MTFYYGTKEIGEVWYGTKKFGVAWIGTKKVYDGTSPGPMPTPGLESVKWSLSTTQQTMIDSFNISPTSFRMDGKTYTLIPNPGRGAGEDAHSYSVGGETIYFQTEQMADDFLAAKIFIISTNGEVWSAPIKGDTTTLSLADNTLVFSKGNIADGVANDNNFVTSELPFEAYLTQRKPAGRVIRHTRTDNFGLTLAPGFEFVDTKGFAYLNNVAYAVLQYSIPKGNESERIQALHTINETTGLATRVGTVNIPGSVVDITEHSGQLWALVWDGNGYLDVLNTTTGAATRDSRVLPYNTNETSLVSHKGKLYIGGAAHRGLLGEIGDKVGNTRHVTTLPPVAPGDARPFNPAGGNIRLASDGKYIHASNNQGQFWVFDSDVLGASATRIGDDEIFTSTFAGMASMDFKDKTLFGLGRYDDAIFSVIPAPPKPLLARSTRVTSFTVWPGDDIWWVQYSGGSTFVNIGGADRTNTNLFSLTKQYWITIDDGTAVSVGMPFSIGGGSRANPPSMRTALTFRGNPFNLTESAFIQVGSTFKLYDFDPET